MYNHYADHVLDRRDELRIRTLTDNCLHPPLDNTGNKQRSLRIADVAEGITNDPSLLTRASVSSADYPTQLPAVRP
jgi:hypothetical protein